MSQNSGTDDGLQPNRRRSGDRRTTPDRRRHRRRDDAPRKGISTLVFLTTLSTITLILFLVYQSGIGDAVNWGKLLYLQKPSDHEFQMGGIELGMSPKTAERKHPNLVLTSVVKGEKVATFKTDGGKYTVWFVSINGIEKAYRIRYDQVFIGKTETDVVEDIGRRHGKPGTSDCARSPQDERKCHFQWWPSGGIALVVLSTTKKPAGTPVTGVTMIATDTYLDGKRIRNLGLE